MGFFQKKCVGLYGVCQKQTMNCPKFSFWQNCGVFGSVFGICLMIEVAEMPRNKEIQGLYGECQKFNFWQSRGMFLAYWKRFLADYSCKISRKPINRAFHGYLWNAKNFKFGRSGDVFGKVFGIYGKVFGILEEIFWQWIYYRLEENHQDCFILPKTGISLMKQWISMH